MGRGGIGRMGADEKGSGEEGGKGGVLIGVKEIRDRY